jgi:ribulose-phosphate 3-epimerase
MGKNVKIAPSILSADFSKLGEQIARAENAGADLFHLDVMDGNFVPNITIGPLIVEAVRKTTNLPLDVHLMIANPEFYVPSFIKAGASYISFHLEATAHAHRVIQKIKSSGVKAGIAINPATAVPSLIDLITEVDFVLIMSVNPGFGGQEFIPHAINKIIMVKEMIEEFRSKTIIEVDGGINSDNIADVVAAGAEMIVAGSAVFQGDRIEKALADLRLAIKGN